MTKKEFVMWQAVTKNSQFRWTEDEIYRLNGRGAFYYHGGENGIYMRIQKDGMLEAGNYEGAIPHIGEAFFKSVVQRQCKDYNEAYTLAMEAGGKQFLIDILSQPDIITPDESDEEAEKYSNYVYKPIYTVTVGNTDIEIAEDKDAKPGKKYCIYEREDLGMTEAFHWKVNTDDFAEAVKVFSEMVQDQVNDFQTTVRQDADERVENASPPAEPIRMNFYCPLTVQMDDSDGYDYVEMDNSVLRGLEDQIRGALMRDQLQGGDFDMAQYIAKSESLKVKLTSAIWDVETKWPEVYGCIHISLKEPLTEEEKAELVSKITGQNSDGFGEGFEQRPIKTDDGDLYISFWHSGDDYFVLDDDAFEQHLSGDQQMGGIQS